MLHRADAVEDLRSSVVVLDRGEDIALEHSHPNEGTIFCRSEGTPTLQDRNCIGVELKLVVFSVPDDVSPDRFDPAQTASELLRFSLESEEASKRSLEPPGNVGSVAGEMYLLTQAATDLRTGQGRPGFLRISPTMPPVGGDTSACFLTAWRAISLFSKSRPLAWKVGPAE